jgi:hypothetical protein
MRTVIALLCLAGSILILGLQDRPPVRPTELPRSAHPLVIRTGFQSRAKWEKIQQEILRPVQAEGVELRARVDFVNEARFRDLGQHQILALVRWGYPHSFVILADEETLAHAELPLLVMDLKENRGRTFRVVPRQVQTVENNLSIASVDFEYFVRAMDADGIYRGNVADGLH